MKRDSVSKISGVSKITTFLSFLVFFAGLLAAEPAAGARWIEMNSGSTEHLRGVWIAQDKSAFAVGDGGTILRFDGSAWSPMTSNTTNALYDVWGSSAADVAASGVDKVLLFEDNSWGEILDTSSGQLYTPVWIAPSSVAKNGSQGDIFVGVPDSGPFPMHWLYRYDREGEEGEKWGFGVAVGSFLVLAFCGTSDPVGYDVYMVTESGDILHTRQLHGDDDLNPVDTHFFQPDPLFLVAAWFNPSNCDEAFGADELGNIHRFNGSSWTDMNAGITDTTLYGMGGSSGSDVYAVGIDGSGNGVIWHYNGTNWSKENIPTVPGLIDVAIGSGIATGEFGLLLRSFTHANQKVGFAGMFMLLFASDE